MTKEAEINGPRQQRTNMLVMATIYVDGSAAPVRVRNLSPAGALIEGSVLPLPGTCFRLSRGTLSVLGELVWQKGRRAGVRFEGSVSVAEWFPQGRPTGVQQQIDKRVQHPRSDSRAVELRARSNLSYSQLTSHSAAELEQLKMEVQLLLAALLADPLVIKRHGSKLQTLDIVAHALGRL